MPNLSVRLFAPTLLALALLSGCGGGNGPSSPHGGSGVVEPAEMTLDGGEKAILIHADGSFELDGHKLGMVRASGELVDAQGKVVATLNDKGNVDFGAANDGTVATIGDDGSLVVKSKSGETFSVAIGADGKLTGTNPAAGKMTVKGANTPAKKKAALLVLVAITMARESDAPPADVQDSPEKKP